MLDMDTQIGIFHINNVKIFLGGPVTHYLLEAKF